VHLCISASRGSQSFHGETKPPARAQVFYVLGLVCVTRSRSRHFALVVCNKDREGAFRDVRKEGLRRRPPPPRVRGGGGGGRYERLSGGVDVIITIIIRTMHIVVCQKNKNINLLWEKEKKKKKKRRYNNLICFNLHLRVNK